MKKRISDHFLAAFAALAGLIIALLWSTGAIGASSVAVDNPMSGGISTLYSMDPLMQTLCFGDAQGGRIFQRHLVKNRCSDLDFNYYPGKLTTGAEGARLGNIIDLGTASDLKSRYGYKETVGDGQGFASLSFNEGKILILKDYGSVTMQELRESEQLFQEGNALATLPVKLGHIYLVRITDRYDKTFQRLVKFIVVAYTPDQSVTIRWQVL